MWAEVYLFLILVILTIGVIYYMVTSAQKTTSTPAPESTPSTPAPTPMSQESFLNVQRHHM